MNLNKENNILTTKMSTVLQILILSCKRFQSVEKDLTKTGYIISDFFFLVPPQFNSLC